MYNIRYCTHYLSPIQINTVSKRFSFSQLKLVRRIHDCLRYNRVQNSRSNISHCTSVWYYHAKCSSVDVRLEFDFLIISKRVDILRDDELKSKIIWFSWSSLSRVFCSSSVLQYGKFFGARTTGDVLVGCMFEPYSYLLMDSSEAVDSDTSKYYVPLPQWSHTYI